MPTQRHVTAAQKHLLVPDPSPALAGGGWDRMAGEHFGSRGTFLGKIGQTGVGWAGGGLLLHILTSASGPGSPKWASTI